MGILGYSLGSDGALFATTVAKDQLVWAVSLSASSSLFSGRQAQAYSIMQVFSVLFGSKMLHLFSKLTGFCLLS